MWQHQVINMKNQILKIKYQNYILNIKNIFTFCIVILIFAFCILNSVEAQQVALSISPPILTAYMKPGKSILIAYDLANSGDPTLISTKVLPFEPYGLNGGIHIKKEFEGPIKFNLDNANIQLGSQFFLKNLDKQQILLRIKVPDETPLGDYYYTLLAETEPPPTFEGVAQSRAKVSIGSNILITVTNSGLVNVNTKVALFDIIARHKIYLFGKTYNIIDSLDPAPFVLTVSNMGNNFVTSEGEINIRGNFGENAKYDLIPQNILAQSQRTLITDKTNIPCEGKKQLALYCQQPITAYITGFFLGLYKASATIRFGENSSTIFASTSFIALPIKFIIGGLIAFCVVLIIISRMREE
jgi:hypothetical protein